MYSCALNGKTDSYSKSTLNFVFRFENLNWGSSIPLTSTQIRFNIQINFHLLKTFFASWPPVSPRSTSMFVYILHCDAHINNTQYSLFKYTSKQDTLSVRKFVHLHCTFFSKISVSIYEQMRMSRPCLMVPGENLKFEITNLKYKIKPKVKFQNSKFKIEIRSSNVKFEIRNAKSKFEIQNQNQKFKIYTHALTNFCFLVSTYIDSSIFFIFHTAFSMKKT